MGGHEESVCLYVKNSWKNVGLSYHFQERGWYLWRVKESSRTFFPDLYWRGLIIYNGISKHRNIKFTENYAIYTF